MHLRNFNIKASLTDLVSLTELKYIAIRFQFSVYLFRLESYIITPFKTPPTRLLAVRDSQFCLVTTISPPLELKSIPGYL